MPGKTLSVRGLVAAFIVSAIAYGFGDVLSTYLALNFSELSSEGMPVAAGMVGIGLNGYVLLLALKLLGLVAFLVIAFLGWGIMAEWLLAGFAIYGSYLTISNVRVFLLGYPLLPPGDPQTYAMFIWMIVLPFMAIGVGLETWNTIKILEGKIEGYGIWNQELKRFKERRARKDA